MTITKNLNGYRVNASTYSLEISPDAISVILAGEEVADLCPSSAVNTLVGKDVVLDTVPGELSFSFDGTEFTWTAKSECWDKTEYVLRAFESHAEYFIRVCGKGDVERVDYFIGKVAENGAGSCYEFDTGYYPVPTVTGAKQCEFSAQFDYTEFSYLTVPPMFCYTFDICGMSEKLALALAAKRGEHNFTYFNYKTQNHYFHNRFWLTTDQSGHTHVDGTWETPTILIYGADSRKAAMKYYSDYYFANGIAKAKDPFEKKPRFWYGPMACGWIEQTAWSIKANIPRSGSDMAYQPLYDHFNEELERRDLHPKLMIIDDKWQSTYGGAEINTEKWSDLRGWIDMNLEKNDRRIMLWYKLWDAEGLPDEMCMIDTENGNRLADPTNPKYQAYLKETMHRLLSPDEGCANAWGLKLDYAFMQPTGRNMKSYSGKFGVELYLELIRLIYTYAKEAKPEAVISGSPCHPLFAQYIDHARLHDYYPSLRRCIEEFTFRKEIYDIAMPGVLFDTDGAAFTSHRDTMRYMMKAPEIGIPDLYCITDMPPITLTDEDWARVAAVWKEYEAKIDALVKE